MDPFQSQVNTFWDEKGPRWLAPEEVEQHLYYVFLERRTCIHFVYFVHKNYNMKFAQFIEAFVYMK